MEIADIEVVRRLEEWIQTITDQKVDISAIYDRNLTEEANKNVIQNALQRLETEAKNRQSLKEYQNKNELETNEVIDRHYSSVKKGVNKICQGYSNLLFLKGRGGIGKSSQIERYLKFNGAIAIPPEHMNNETLDSPVSDFLDPEKTYYLEVTGELSEAYLYRVLYVFNNVILWFRDVNKLLKTLRSIDTLKAATETKSKRLICNNNYSSKSQDIPRQFIYTGCIIFDFNSLKGLSLKEDFEALKTRGDYIDVNLSKEDLSEIMLSICTEQWQTEVTKHLLSNYKQTGFDLINLRTQWKAFKTYEYCQNNGIDWKKEIKDDLQRNMSKIRALLYSLIGRQPVRAKDLKKLLLERGEVNSLRTAHRRIEEWLELEELYKRSADGRNYMISIDRGG